MVSIIFGGVKYQNNVNTKGEPLTTPDHSVTDTRVTGDTIELGTT